MEDSQKIFREAIAFSRDGKIYAMNPDGSNVRLLGDGGLPPDYSSGGYYRVHQMAWSPDGRTIAYSTEDGLGIYNMSIDVFEVKKKLSIMSAMHPAWSPDGRSLAFTNLNYPAFCLNGGSDCFNIARIFIASADGVDISPTDLSVDTLQPFQFWDTNPNWSPDGERIVFASSRHRIWGIPESEVQNIYMMNPDGTGVTRLTESIYEETNPVWSPDGKKIAFDRRGNENYSWSIYVMNADGSDVFQVTHNLMQDRYYGHSPTWSPDGTKLAFVSDHDGNGEIYVINIDGTGLTRLTHDPREDAYPAWSPGGIEIN